MSPGSWPQSPALHQYLYLPCTAHSIFKGIHCAILLFLCPLFSPVSLFCSLSEEHISSSLLNSDPLCSNCKATVWMFKVLLTCGKSKKSHLIPKRRNEMKFHNVRCFLQVIVKVNNGIRDFSTSVTPKQSLCDGRWHRITGEESCVSWVSLIK